MKLLCLLTALITISAQAIEVVPNEYIVKLKKGTQALQSSIMDVTGVESYRSFKAIGSQFAVIKMKERMSSMSILSNHPSIEYIEPNYIWKAIGTKVETADPDFTKLWGLQNTGNNEPVSPGRPAPAPGVSGSDINALNAWQITKGSNNIRIAVIDTGIDYNHSDLAANMWTNEAEANGQPGVDDDGNGYVDDIHGYDFSNNDGDPMDDHSHGTHCAGTIGAVHDNNVGIAGVMANVQLVAVKFLSGQGSGTTEGAIRSIDYATQLGVDIMSNSWGGGGFSQALLEAIERAQARGIIFVAAAGNSASNNDNAPHYPSNYEVDNVISVAAHSAQDMLASFSCFGARTVHVAAPGHNILSTVINDSYAIYSGTSMATPHVSGVVGLYLAHHGSTDPATLRDSLMKSSVYSAGYGRTTLGRGRVDAHAFLRNVVTQKPALPNPADWVADTNNHQWESIHPYDHNSADSQTFTVAGARFVRAVFEKIELESSYDTLKVYEGQAVVEVISGTHAGEYTSTYAEGDSIRIDFNSDHSVNKWGFKLKEIQYIR